MPYILPVLIFLLAYNNERSKTVTMLILLYMWALVGLNTFTPDYAEYERLYYNPLIWDVEYGYRFLCFFFGGFGFDYQQFRMFYGVIYVLTLYSGIKRNTEYSNMVLALYLLWPFIPGVSGARYSLATAIFYNAVPYLYSKKRFSTIKYILIVGLACLFHTASIVFFGYLFARRKYTTKQYLLVFLLIVTLVISIKSGLLENIAYSLNIRRIIKWISMSTEVGRLNIVGFLCYSIVLVANFCVTSQVGKMALRSAEDKSQIDESMDLDTKKMKYTLMLNINFLSLVIIPFYLISSEYARYLNTILMLNYCLFAGFRKECFKINYENKLIYSILFIFVIIMTAVFYMYSQRSHDVLATLVDNLLFQR